MLARYNHEAAKWLRVGDDARPRKRMTRRAWAGGSEHFWVYVHEHARERGFHTHLLCVIPPDKATAFREWTLKFFARQIGDPRVHRHAIHFSPSTKKRGFQPYRGRSEADRTARCWHWFRYIIKSLDPRILVLDNQKKAHAAREVFKPWPFVNTAPVHCAKLAGASENIGKNAQDRTDFYSKWDAGDFAHLYDGSELDEYRRRLEEEAHEKEIQQVLRAIQSD